MDVIALDIAEDLRAALAQFEEIAGDLAAAVKISANGVALAPDLNSSPKAVRQKGAR